MSKCMVEKELIGARSQPSWSPIKVRRLEVLDKATRPFKKHAYHTYQIWVCCSQETLSDVNHALPKKLPEDP